ncbi:MAG TPA: toll/interleukin-1 receptor domain-containing protein [Pyrinomonadaceae bacterium]|nr:toll/interleukin-1 receptor domain-containing protein [Pyrinomonadaceae bacterium]
MDGQADAPPQESPAAGTDSGSGLRVRGGRAGGGGAGGGGAPVWLDQWDIPSGADWDYEIDRALYDCRHFLIVLSPAAVESEEVRGELRTALEEDKRVVPVLYRACRVPRRLRLLQHIDCTGADSGPGEEAVRLLLDALGR